jgi:hypothetical protein
MYVTRLGQVRTWHGKMHRGDKELPAHSMMQGEDNALVKQQQHDVRECG